MTVAYLKEYGRAKHMGAVRHLEMKKKKKNS